MAKVVVERKKVGMPFVTRRNVAPGQIFSLVKRDGSVGRKQYLALGSNGRFLSINIANGELASTANGAKKVTVVGKGRFKFSNAPTWQHRNTTRAAVKGNELFKVEGGHKVYANLGARKSGGFLALDTADPQSGDYSAGNRADKHVTVVGTYVIEAEVV